MSAKKSNHPQKGKQFRDSCSIIGFPRTIDSEKGIIEVRCRIENSKGSEDYIVEVRGNVISPGKIEIGFPGIHDQIRARLFSLYSENAFVGEKVTEGGIKGSEKRWGTEAEKKELWSAYQSYINEKYNQHSFLSHTFLAKIAAEYFSKDAPTELRHDVSARTIFRRTQDPRKIQ